MKVSGYTNTLLLTIILAFFSCSKDLECISKVAAELTISNDAISTRSVLPDKIENKITEVTLWVYDSEGGLAATQNFKHQETDKMILPLDDKETYNIYALVNMGEIHAPASERQVADFEYQVPSYTDIRQNGIPMTGILSDFHSSSRHGTIRVRRLFARVNLITAPGEVSPDEISSVEVFNCNMNQKPFSRSGSKAVKLSDVISGEENDRICRYGWEGNHFVFYIPENLQGNLLPDNTDQNQKTPENLILHNKKQHASLCTYIETTVCLKDPTQHNGIRGTAKYRFLLGEDNTSDFNIRRNVDYDVRLSLTWNGLFYEDNWRVDNSLLIDARELEVEGISGYTTGNPDIRISRGRDMNIIPGQHGGVSIRFNDGSNPRETTDSPYGSTYDSESNLFTLEKYNQEGGWTMSEESQQLLNDYKIRWTIGQAVLDHNPNALAYIDKSNEIGFVFQEPLFYDSLISSEHFRVYMVFNVPDRGITEGTIIPIDFCTMDNTRSVRINLKICSKTKQ